MRITYSCREQLLTYCLLVISTYKIISSPRAVLPAPVKGQSAETVADNIVNDFNDVRISGACRCDDS